MKLIFANSRTQCGVMVFSLGLALFGAGCGAMPNESAPQEQQHAIDNGALTKRFPSVVFLTNAAYGGVGQGTKLCAATMLTATVAVTARHCNKGGFPMIIDTGNDQSDFVDHVVDTSLVHPAADLMLIHLSTPAFTGNPHVSLPPITGAPPDAVSFPDVDNAAYISDQLPSEGDTVLAFGFAQHRDTPDDSLGTYHKRYAVETVNSVSADRLGLYEGTDVDHGIIRGGDSGGPVFYGRSLIAINDLGERPPQPPPSNQETALPLDVPWILDNIDLDAPTVTDSLYILRNGILLRANPKFGNYVGVGADDFSTTATSMAAFPVSTSNIYVVANNSLYSITTDGVSTALPRSIGAWDGPTKLTAMGTNLFIMQGGCLRKINPSTGAYSAPIGICNWTGVTALTNVNGVLYATNNGNLYAVSAVNGFQSLLASGLGTVTNMTAMGSSLYIQQDDNIIRSSTSGTLTTIGSGWANTVSMAGLDGLLYVTQSDFLLSVSVRSGANRELGFRNWKPADGNTIMMVSIPASP